MNLNGDLSAELLNLLQSFEALGRTLNLSSAARELEISPETVQSQVSKLEDLKGARLLVPSPSGWQPTLLGENLLPAAKAILYSSTRFLGGVAVDPRSLSHATFRTDDGQWFYAQRHALSAIWRMSVPLIEQSLQGWISARGKLEVEALEIFRPFMLVHQRSAGEWICREVGAKSSYATWLGQIEAEKAIGKPLHKDPIESRADRYLREPYSHVSLSGSAWYDHVCARFPRPKDQKLVQANYQRLVAPYVGSNGEEVIVTIVARTNRISIDGLDDADIPKIAEEDLMEFAV